MYLHPTTSIDSNKDACIRLGQHCREEAAVWLILHLLVLLHLVRGPPSMGTMFSNQSTESLIPCSRSQGGFVRGGVLTTETRLLPSILKLLLYRFK